MSEDAQSLDDLFNGTEEAEAETETETTVEEEAEATEEATAEEGATAAPEESDDEGQKPETAKSEDKHWSETAYMDEKRKRQELERQLQAMQSQRQPEKAPDIFEDQDGYNHYIDQKLQRARLEDRVIMSQELMRMSFPDYDEKEAVFVDLVKDDPALYNKMINHPMPAKFVRDTVMKHERLQALENVDAWEAKKTAELEAKIRAELEEKLGQKSEQEQKLSKIKPSLANARSTGKTTDEHYEKSLGELFGR